MQIPHDLNAQLGPRDVVAVEGPDALTYLQSQISQNINDQAVGESRWTFVLQPTGKIDALAAITRVTDDRFELATDAGFGEALLARLNRFKIRVKAETTLTEATGEPTPDQEADRVALGWPQLGREIVPGEALVAGTGLERVAVSYTKGCYPGQELVERMDSRGANAPRTLRRLTLAEGTAPGDPVIDGSEPVGSVTSIAGTSALAWIKRGSDLGDPVDFELP